MNLATSILDAPNISHPALTQLVFYGNIHDKRLEDEKNKLIQNLEIEIDSKIQEKARETSGRFILLVGDSIRSLEAIGSYVYCIRGSKEFYFYSLGGMAAEEVEGISSESDYYNCDDKVKFGNLLDRLRQGCAVFLGNMECRDSNWLKRFASKIGAVKNKWYSKGMLIIGTTCSIDSLPRYFTEVFEVINLEPEKEGKTVDKLETKPEENTFSFPTPQGSKWDDVEIRFIKEAVAKITVKGVSDTVNFAMIKTGFRNKQNGKFTRLWGVFKLFAEEKGVINYDKINLRKTEALKKDDIYDLKDTLRDLFGISGSPISNYNNAHEYRTFFKIYIEEDYRFSDDDEMDEDNDS